MLSKPNPVPKGPSLIRQKLKAKHLMSEIETQCRAAVHKRDKGRCRVPNCNERGIHLHHVTYRSRGGKWVTANIASLCPLHHAMVHGKELMVAGNADEELVFTGPGVEKLRFRV